MATESRIDAGEWFVGEDHTLQIDVVDSAGAVKNMTGWSLTWSLTRKRGEGPTIISKTTGASQITIGNGSGTGDRATVTVARADTVDLAPGRYYHSLWRTDGANDTVLSYGDCVLSAPAVQS